MFYDWSHFQEVWSVLAERLHLLQSYNQMEGCVAILHFRIQVSPIAHQSLHHRSVSLMGSNMQWSELHITPHIEVAVTLQKCKYMYMYM